MSAINPASFVTPPTAGLQPNPLFTPEAQAERPQPHEGRAYGHARDGVDAGREGGANQMGMMRNAYLDSYQPFGHSPRQAEPALGGLASADPFSPPVYNQNVYGGLDSSYGDFAGPNGPSPGSSRLHPTAGDWTSRFQGLSLGS